MHDGYQPQKDGAEIHMPPSEGSELRTLPGPMTIESVRLFWPDQTMILFEAITVRDLDSFDISIVPLPPIKKKKRERSGNG